MTASLAIKAAKKELRLAMKARLSSIPAPLVESQSLAVFKALTTFEPFLAAQRVSIYLSMPSGEIQTAPIVKFALQQGKHVFVPYLYRVESPNGPKRLMDMVMLKSLEDYEGLEKDGWGIPTVSEKGLEGRSRILEFVGNGENKEKGLDFICLPGVAFDLEENEQASMVKRLGHGKGFYDVFLHRYQELYERDRPQKIKLYGLALEEQFLKGSDGLTVPVDDQDWPLDGVVLGDSSIVDCGLFRGAS